MTRARKKLMLYLLEDWLRPTALIFAALWIVTYLSHLTPPIPLP